MILVTGGTGLLGSHLLLELCKEGHKVRALKRKTSSLKQVEHVFRVFDSNALLNNIEWVEGDVNDIYSILNALTGIKYVYNCASIVSFDRKEEAEMLKTNIEGTANVVNACLEAGIEKLCHVSSVSTLSFYTNGQELSEKSFWKSSPSNSAYSISKYGGEREAWRAIAEGLNVVIVNPAVVVGASVFKSGSSAMLYLSKKGNRFYTKGQTGFVDAIDVSRIMMELMKSNIKNERFVLCAENIGYKEFYSIANQQFGNPTPAIYCGKLATELAWRFFKLISLLNGSSPQITKDAARASNTRKTFSSAKIRSAINFSFSPLKRSIEQACRNYQPD